MSEHFIPQASLKQPLKARYEYKWLEDISERYLRPTNVGFE